MLTYIVYTHSSYNDVFTVQNDFYKNVKEQKYLFIDKINNDMIYNFDKIFLYDDTLNYSKRIYQCLLQANIKDKYILFSPDTNILIRKNDEMIYDIIKIMDDNNIHRFDFSIYKFIDNPENINYKNYKLIKNNDGGNFIYNVGTAIYNTMSFFKLVSLFDIEYRKFECACIVQDYALHNMNSYYINCINCNDIINTGYYKLTEIFVYIHITHFGKLLTLDNNVNEMECNLQKIYENIFYTYNFDKKLNDRLH